MKISSLIFSSICLLLASLYAQEYKASGTNVVVAQQADSIVDSKIVCYENSDKLRIVGGVFRNQELSLRVASSSAGEKMFANENIGLSMRIPFPSLLGEIGRPYAAARLTKIEGTMTIHLHGDDFLLVQDLAQKQEIDSLPRKQYYQVKFRVKNIPDLWYRWNEEAPSRILPFHFSMATLSEQNVVVMDTKGSALGSLYRLGQWHLAALSFEYHYEYASLDYEPRIEKLVEPDITTILKEKSNRELDAAFTAINSIFSSTENVNSVDSIVHLYSLKKAIDGISYYTKKWNPDGSVTFDLLGQNVEKLSQGVEAGTVDRKQLSSELNKLRMELIQNFAAIYKNTAASETSEEGEEDEEDDEDEDGEDEDDEEPLDLEDEDE